MSRPWQYPIFLIPHGGGYASIVDSNGEPDADQSLVVCQREDTAAAFMADCGILGAPRELHNDREFGWLLQSLHAPVVNVAFDPSSQLGDDSAATRRMSVRDLLENYLIADNSPWSYPVYVVAQGRGFVSIEGHDNQGRAIMAVGFFSSEERVAEYLEAAGEEGTPCPLETLDEARSFLTEISPQAAAVAWNPSVSDGQRVAKHCFPIDTLLEKYLVVSDKDTESPS